MEQREFEDHLINSCDIRETTCKYCDIVLKTKDMYEIPSKFPNNLDVDMIMKNIVVTEQNVVWSVKSISNYEILKFMSRRIATILHQPKTLEGPRSFT